MPKKIDFRKGDTFFERSKSASETMNKTQRGSVKGTTTRAPVKSGSKTQIRAAPQAKSKASSKTQIRAKASSSIQSRVIKPSLSKQPSPPLSKRRGRRPQKILDESSLSSDHQDDATEQSSNSAVIVRLPSHLLNAQSINKTGSKTTLPKRNQTGSTRAPIEPEDSEGSNDSSSDVDDDQLSEGMFKNDIPCDDKCHNCEKNEKALVTLRGRLAKYEKKDTEEKGSKIYINKLNLVMLDTRKRFKVCKTNVKCWWDAHSFSNYPWFLPELFHNNTYHVIGCFCSPNCALAYNLYAIKDSKTHHRKSLMYKLYRELHNLTPDEIVEIREAPPKEILVDFGGDMPIDVFRRSFIETDKEYNIFVPPIRPINMIIEERSVGTDIDDSDGEYVLKRSKPLIKKGSIIASLNIKVAH
ncbi:Viral transcription factor 2 [uncultured virus]|nr:Viral transcription factor 2 [uncultured virus]